MINSNARGITFIKVMLALFMLFALLVLLFSCRTTKSFQADSSSVSKKDNAYYDSLRTSDSIRIAKYYEEKLKEMSTDISFYRGNEVSLINALDQLRDTIDARGFLTEALKKRINGVLDSMQTLCNSKVKVNTDGSYEVSGPISRLKLQLSDMKKKMDSVVSANTNNANVSKETVKETEKTEASVEQVVKKGWPWYVWYLLGFGSAYIVFNRRKIISFGRKVFS